MDIEVDDMTGSAYSNFVESIKSKYTRRGYVRDLLQFLEKIPDDFFMQHLNKKPKSHNPKNLRRISNRSKFIVGLIREPLELLKRG